MVAPRGEAGALDPRAAANPGGTDLHRGAEHEDAERLFQGWLDEIEPDLRKRAPALSSLPQIGSGLDLERAARIAAAGG